VRRGVAIAAIAVLVAGLQAVAEAAVPVDKQAIVLLRILAYDKNLPQRAGDRIVIGIVHADSKAARGAAEAMHAALEAQTRRITVSGKLVTVVVIANSSGLRRTLGDLGVTAVYLTSGLGDALPEISRACRAVGALSFTDDLSYLQRGVAIGFGLDERQSRIRILVDLIEARAEGARLSTELLRLVKVVRR
jgi:hypothetical protein